MQTSLSFFFFSSRRRHTRFKCDWSSDVCSSDLLIHAAAALSWSAAEWIKNGRASALGAISGAVAGLVAITPAAGFVGPMPALAIGLIAGVACYWMVTKVKAIFGYYDSLHPFGLPGAPAPISALLT